MDGNRRTLEARQVHRQRHANRHLRLGRISLVDDLLLQPAPTDARKPTRCLAIAPQSNGLLDAQARGISPDRGNGASFEWTGLESSSP